MGGFLQRTKSYFSTEFVKLPSFKTLQYWHGNGKTMKPKYTKSSPKSLPSDFFSDLRFVFSCASNFEYKSYQIT